MSFFGSLFGGSNPTLKNDIGSVGSNAGFASGQGQNLTASSGNFWNSLLSGDQGAISKVLAPQIGAIQKRSQQQKNTNSQFGTRSGGTGSANAMIDTNATSDINSMIANLTGQAGTAAGSLGTNLLSQGTAGYMDQAKLSQDQMSNYMNSIFGKAIGTGIGGLEGFGIGKL